MYNERIDFSDFDIRYLSALIYIILYCLYYIVIWSFAGFIG